MANTPAYYVTERITVVKCFVFMALGVDIITVGINLITFRGKLDHFASA
jgi:hypothetical protein